MKRIGLLFTCCALLWSFSATAQNIPGPGLPWYSGSWVDDSRGGEGWILEVIDDQRVAIFWFTFDPQGNRTWLVGVAERDGDTISADMQIASGPLFGAGFSQDDISYEDWGSLEIRFLSCTTAELNYNSGIAGYGSGSLSPRRLSAINGLDCENPDAEPATRFSAMSGSWADGLFGGEGWVIEAIDEYRYAIFWFTYDPDGARTWMIGVGERSGNQVIADMLFASGPKFGQGFDQGNVGYQDWGSLLIGFERCDSGTLEFESQVNGYGNGSRLPGRLTTLAALECAEPPNVLLIIADDYGKDAFSPYGLGAEVAPTPNLASLADEGLLFDGFWSNPTCAPTRAALLTGQYGIQTGILIPGDTLPDTEFTVHDYLAQELPGTYATAVVGKWHLNRNNDLDHPNALGVEYFAGPLTAGLQAYDNWTLTENGVQTPMTEYATSKYVDLSIDWIESQDQPWFLWLAFNAPHSPLHLPPAELHSQSLPGTEEDIENNPDPYYRAMVEAMDTEIGRLLSHLDEQERENTLIVFMGDNGTPNNVIQSPYARRRAKGSMYQGGINVPFFVSGGPVSRVGEREDALVSVTDMFATIADVAGASPIVQVDSSSMVELFSHDSDGARTFIYTDGLNADTEEHKWAIRNQRYKMIADETGRLELYDLLTDPFEADDLVSRSAVPEGVLDELQTQVIEIQQSDSP